MVKMPTIIASRRFSISLLLSDKSGNVSTEKVIIERTINDWIKNEKYRPSFESLLIKESLRASEIGDKSPTTNG